MNVSQQDHLGASTYVRLLCHLVEASFTKSFVPIYTIEVYEIYKVEHNSIPVLYYLQDVYGEKIEGVVYRSEIIPTLYPKYFLIDKIIKTKINRLTKKKSYFVKWLGYPDKFNEWVSDLKKKQNI